MTREDSLDLCRRWQEAFVRHDVDALADLYSDTATVDSPLAGNVSGREALVDAQRRSFEVFPDIVTSFETPIVEDDHAAVIGEVTGRRVGSLMGLPPSEKLFRFRIVFLFEIADGRIVHDRRVYDFTGLLLQLGVLKAKPV